MKKIQKLRAANEKIQAQLLNSAARCFGCLGFEAQYVLHMYFYVLLCAFMYFVCVPINSEFKIKIEKLRAEVEKIQAPIRNLLHGVLDVWDSRHSMYFICTYVLLCTFMYFYVLLCTLYVFQ